jgi:aminodeoxyfutalosine synthase
VTINTAIADRARANEALTAAELDELATADILSLGMLADEVRRARVGGVVTFVRVAEIQGANGANGANGAKGANGAEVRITQTGATLEETVAAVVQAKTAAGHSVLSGFSLADLIDRGWGSLTDVLKQLKQAGLDAIVEAPLDRLADAEAALQACQDAGLAVQCLSIQKPNAEARTPLLLKARALAARFPWLTTIAPLSREQSVAVPTTGYDDVRGVALARLALPNVPTVQVDWAQYGPKLAQVALTFGANDLDRVSTADDESLGRRRNVARDVFERRAAGFEARERTGIA